MDKYTDQFWERRSEKDRRDWNEFILHDQRKGKDRRSGTDRRLSQKPFYTAEKRRLSKKSKEKNTSKRSHNIQKHYSIHDAAKKAGISSTTILLWLKKKWLNDAEIHRDNYGRRSFTEYNIEQIITIRKSRELK